MGLGEALDKMHQEQRLRDEYKAKTGKSSYDAGSDFETYRNSQIGFGEVLITWPKLSFLSFLLMLVLLSIGSFVNGISENWVEYFVYFCIGVGICVPFLWYIFKSWNGILLRTLKLMSAFLVLIFLLILYLFIRGSDEGKTPEETLIFIIELGKGGLNYFLG